ncbi:hemerythrin HHE cation binding domain-containing protein [Coniochaeta sp. 2T2.1]|nr:hemerythrin HHE cation binding domain-containing protein [Coniochaeta sp. 2T2.1]
MTSNDVANHPFPLINTPISQLPAGTEPDAFHRCASEMACVHNMVIRGLNSIYLQAQHVADKDVKPFLGYASCFYDLLSVHHKGEEEDLFPQIEKMAGKTGIMDQNVEQHRMFHDGLEEYNAYIRLCLNSPDNYDGGKLVRIIDSFGPALAQHLAAEITTILELAKYGKKMDELEKLFAAWAEKDTRQLSIPGALTWGFFNHDRDFEGGLWKEWPPAPAPLVLIVRHVTYWVHSDWWKFAPCDPSGKMKSKLHAAPQMLE